MNEENKPQAVETNDESTSEKAKDAVSNIADKAGDIAGKVAEEAKEAMGTMGGFLKKVGEAVVTTAENATGKDLNKDGTIGDKKD